MSNQAPSPLDVLASAGSSLEAVQRQLEHADRLATLGTLAAGVAHEINNLLTPALGYLQLAQSRPDDHELAAKALERAASSLSSISSITEAILGFARIEDQASAETTYPNIHQIIDAALACLARDPADDGIRLEVDIRTDAAVRIRPVALQQVLLNLLLNACAAVREQRGTVRVTAIERSDGMTQLTVADNGPGIPDHVRQTLFQPFVSARKAVDAEATTAQSGGSGLGLSVSRHLVEKAGGRIEVESSPDKGARFVVTIPTVPRETASKTA